jgi:hypothetical protein
MAFIYKRLLNFSRSVATGDWLVSGDGDTYFVDVNHQLGSLLPLVRLLELPENRQVEAHSVEVLDQNWVRVKVSRVGVDARFSGTIVVDP